MTLTIHRGTHEIGGSCVELRTAEAKMLIDFGLPLDYEKRTPEEQEQIRRTAAEWCKGVDALFLSHAHADHYGLFDLLPDDTPVYATEETFAMLALDGILGIRIPWCSLMASPIIRPSSNGDTNFGSDKPFASFLGEITAITVRSVI